MAIVERWFSTSSAGANDGTSWANRAQLVNGATWSTVITGFDFTSDSLICWVGPGTHSPTAAISTASFTNPPSRYNNIYFFACDSSGVELAVPDPTWVCNRPEWSATNMPIINTTTNITGISFNMDICYCRLLKFTSSGNTNIATVAGALDWCQVVNSTNNSTTFCHNGNGAWNSFFTCTGAAYNAVIGTGGTLRSNNVRIVGVAGSSGNRRGIAGSSTSATVMEIHRFAVIGVGGDGVRYNSSTTGTSVSFKCSRGLVYGVGGDGFSMEDTTTGPPSGSIIDGALVVGNTGAGINGQSSTRAHNCRLRDNGGGNFSNMGNFPETTNYITDSDDATEFVNAAGGDFRINNTATIWGKGYGPGADQAAAGVGIASLLHSPLVG